MTMINTSRMNSASRSFVRLIKWSILLPFFSSDPLLRHTKLAASYVVSKLFDVTSCCQIHRIGERLPPPYGGLRLPECSRNHER